MMNKKGQNIAEYTIIIGLVGAALLAMSAYFQRGIQVVIKEPVDHLGGFDSGIFIPQRIQEIGMEANVDTTLKWPTPPVTFTNTVNNTDVVTTNSGGGRNLVINESTRVSPRRETSYKKIEYDQIQH